MLHAAIEQTEVAWCSCLSRIGPCLLLFVQISRLCGFHQLWDRHVSHAHLRINPRHFSTFPSHASRNLYTLITVLIRDLLGQNSPIPLLSLPHTDRGVWGLGFGVWGLGFGVW